MSRATYLLQSDRALLETWGHQVFLMFGEMPYLVGSSLQRQDFRDVDVRVMLDAERHDLLMAAGVDLDRLHLAVSLWGQKATGLPIEFQVQQMESANEDFPGTRIPIGMNVRTNGFRHPGGFHTKSWPHQNPGRRFVDPEMLP